MQYEDDFILLDSSFEITKYHNSMEEWKTLHSRVDSYIGHTCYSNSNSLRIHIRKLLRPSSSFIDFYKGYIRLKPNMYYIKGIKYYGFRRNRHRKILYSMKANFMSGVLIRETDGITNKIKARIPIFSWRLRKSVQLELFKTEERIKK